MRAHRLSVLLRNFGLSPKDLVNKEAKVVIPLLRSEYYRLAKEQHPDLAPDDLKVEAARRFTRLRSDFEEASNLLEAGIRPWESSTTGSTDSKTRFVYQQPWHKSKEQPWEDPWTQPKFDLKTRIKGHLYFWSGLLIFLTFFREFLVFSAGSCYAWSLPKTINPFWVRRFKDEWNDSADEVTEEKKKKALEDEQQPPTYAPVKKYRDVDNFYQKRGISNVRKKYEPRGLGPSL